MARSSGRSSRPRPGKSILRKGQTREIGIFIDGVNLDRVGKRLSKRISLSALVQKLSTGGQCITARYYTMIPNEDDSRQRSFLDVVRSSGLYPCVKRLPPVGFEKQISIDVEMASDILAFGLGADDLLEQSVVGHYGERSDEQTASQASALGGEEQAVEGDPEQDKLASAKRILYVVCPNKEICYPFRLLRKESVRTVVADFSSGRRDDIIALAHEFVDLSDEENLWQKK